MASGIKDWGANVLAGFTHEAKKMPEPMISSVDTLLGGYAGRFRFILTLNNFTYGFQSIGGLKYTRKLDTIQEGGVNERDIYVGAPDDSSATLTLKRGMLLREWSVVTSALLMAAASIPNNIARRTALTLVGMTDAQYTLEHGPALGDIKVYNSVTDRSSKNPKDWKTKFILSDWWTFLSLGIESRDVDDLDATNSGAAMEQLELKVVDLVQRPVSWMPTNATSMISMFKDDTPSQEAAETSRQENKKEKEKQAEEEQEEKEKNAAYDKAKNSPEAKETEAELGKAKEELENTKNSTEEAKKKAEYELEKAKEELKEAKENNDEDKVKEAEEKLKEAEVNLEKVEKENEEELEKAKKRLKDAEAAAQARRLAAYEAALAAEAAKKAAQEAKRKEAEAKRKEAEAQKAKDKELIVEKELEKEKEEGKDTSKSEEKLKSAKEKAEQAKKEAEEAKKEADDAKEKAEQAKKEAEEKQEEALEEEETEAENNALDEYIASNT